MDLKTILKKLFPKTTTSIYNEGRVDHLLTTQIDYEAGWCAGYDALENEISEALGLDEKSKNYLEPIVWHVKCLVKKCDCFKKTIMKELGEDEEDL